MSIADTFTGKIYEVGGELVAEFEPGTLRDASPIFMTADPRWAGFPNSENWGGVIALFDGNASGVFALSASQIAERIRNAESQKVHRQRTPDYVDETLAELRKGQLALRR